jgi:error-prone DNA polymerase
LELILSGVFESLEKNRRKLLLSIRSKSAAGDVDDFSAFEKARFELALTGLTFSGHPISFLRDRLSKQGVIKSSQLEQRPDGEKILVAGLRVVLHTPPTRSGRRVVFITLEDEDGLADITVFSDVRKSAQGPCSGETLSSWKEGCKGCIHARSHWLPAMWCHYLLWLDEINSLWLVNSTIMLH